MKRILLSIYASILVCSLFGQTVSKYIIVDQFGYLPEADKVAIIADPQVGFNADDSYFPGKELELINVSTDVTVYKAIPVVWNKGQIDKQAGDKGWWFDFSSIKDTGTYYVLDREKNMKSYNFRIANNVYLDALNAACKMFYYNRCNSPKQEPYADKRWTDKADNLGPNQDSQCHDITDRENPAKVKDLSGGWWDAGDMNKYVTFLYDVLNPMLSAFDYNSAAFKDNLNIPESGNGIPDIVDEMVVELNWMVKMQEPDGGVHIKMGEIMPTRTQPPSTSTNARFYGPVCSSSTIVLSGIFAHAALILDPFPMYRPLRDELRRRSELAWKWYLAHPKCDTCDNQIIRAGDADLPIIKQDKAALVAAFYLFKLTRNQLYHNYFKMNILKHDMYSQDNSDLYATTFHNALLEYAHLPKGDSALASQIMIAQKANADNIKTLYGWNDTLSLYRAYTADASYHWGSVMPIASTGIVNELVSYFGVDYSRDKAFSKKALGIINFFHGVNPLNLMYLSNMYEKGGDNCVNQLYHTWFADGSQWDDCRTSAGPPPGYLTGGPSTQYSIKKVSPPYGQPAMKSYKDWNVGWPENSWEITEPAIYYQALYIRLLAPYVHTK
jgi:endoglucanase